MSHRVRFLSTLLAACLVIGLLAPAARPAAAQDPASQVIALVNQLRASLGLYALTPNWALTAAAQGHANWMAANGSFSHTGEGGSSPQDRANAAGYQGWVAENIVGGTNLSPQQGIIWWQNSPIHYAGMTSSRYIEVGAGYARSGDQNMYVMVFGVPSDRPVGGSQSSGGGNAQQAPAPVIRTPVEVAAPREDGSIVHVIQIGQTAWDVAAAYNVPLADILRFNNLSDDPIILPGDEIVVRFSDQPTPGPAEPQYHTVEAGETAWTIAAKYHIDLGVLLAMNGFDQRPILHEGDQVIIALPEGMPIPPTAPPPTPPSTHIVQEGQTAWAIALRYGLSLDDLLAMNGLTDASVLLVGTELTIRWPDPTAAPTPEPSLTPAATEIALQPTASPSPTATEPPLPTPTPSPSPTPTATPAVPALLDLVQTSDPLTLLGVGIVGLGLLGLGVFVGAEVRERRRRRK